MASSPTGARRGDGASRRGAQVDRRGSARAGVGAGVTTRTPPSPAAAAATSACQRADEEDRDEGGHRSAPVEGPTGSTGQPACEVPRRRSGCRIGSRTLRWRRRLRRSSRSRAGGRARTAAQNVAPTRVHEAVEGAVRDAARSRQLRPARPPDGSGRRAACRARGPRRGRPGSRAGSRSRATARRGRAGRREVRGDGGADLGRILREELDEVLDGLQHGADSSIGLVRYTPPTKPACGA